MWRFVVFETMTTVNQNEKNVANEKQSERKRWRWRSRTTERRNNELNNNIRILLSWFVSSLQSPVPPPLPPPPHDDFMRFMSCVAWAMGHGMMGPWIAVHRSVAARERRPILFCFCCYTQDLSELHRQETWHNWTVNEHAYTICCML